MLFSSTIMEESTKDGELLIFPWKGKTTTYFLSEQGESKENFWEFSCEMLVHFWTNFVQCRYIATRKKNKHNPLQILLLQFIMLFMLVNVIW